ncbi:50S ribosomal protein L24 [Candidatus Nomurabacteria bacterium RIFCSPLOWO2_01_FULL_40_15]|uniref:Large ribosomal subunit protein uL24 n=1 Tax=Candidatus Nomurabacteria bacterium RIFCSPLOWO2_01_FULL_40_15 TaxID=1801772 RepID=A0A1F6X8K1_9BACT|nr:MAG: 50S ribosomal protein L24 [Candidatus Nomurabacteria bacterium RIFCSPLOWO2_01_FULL_40_15]
MKLKKGDNIIVITGKDKGKKGKITRVLVKDNKVVIEGINTMKKHQRPKKSDEKGQMINIAMPMHASNVKKLD